ncbi:hypothetical protein EUGRSUZ_B00879 [Eucalyptus grandis]|uniref:Uncharacterized protein n=2 Tax=Eucalyptus grandis TaxID=71139 RepID=A0ACC3LNM2_EUCGR|nr:hypothetical protein EUGRSUZ_B00879 [Eucalyptus grandis]
MHHNCMIKEFNKGQNRLFRTLSKASLKFVLLGGLFSMNISNTRHQSIYTSVTNKFFCPNIKKRIHERTIF